MAQWCSICQERQGMLSSRPGKTKDGECICFNCAAARGLTCTSEAEDGSTFQHVDFAKVAEMTLSEVKEYTSLEMQLLTAELERVVVTTTDIDAPYDVLSPIFFQVSNKGVFSSDFSKLSSYYKTQMEKKKPASSTPFVEHVDLGALWGESGVSQSNWEEAFYICVEELKKRAYSIGADVVVGMRVDIDLDVNAVSFFYMQMYGTAVKLRD